MPYVQPFYQLLSQHSRTWKWDTSGVPLIISRAHKAQNTFSSLATSAFPYLEPGKVDQLVTGLTLPVVSGNFMESPGGWQGCIISPLDGSIDPSGRLLKGFAILPSPLCWVARLLSFQPYSYKDSAPCGRKQVLIFFQYTIVSLLPNLSNWWHYGMDQGLLTISCHCLRTLHIT